jgi:hypothetical protein
VRCRGGFRAVGNFYRDFSATTEEEVRALRVDAGHVAGTVPAEPFNAVAFLADDDIAKLGLA